MSEEKENNIINDDDMRDLNEFYNSKEEYNNTNIKTTINLKETQTGGKTKRNTEYEKPFILSEYL